MSNQPEIPANGGLAGRKSATVVYAAIGVVAGAVLPVVAAIIDTALGAGSVTLANVLSAWRGNPAVWLVTPARSTSFSSGSTCRT
jgi:hypothetical protein